MMSVLGKASQYPSLDSQMLVANLAELQLAGPARVKVSEPEWCGRSVENLVVMCFAFVGSIQL